MPRLSYFGALLGMAALLSSPAAAQNVRAKNSVQNGAQNGALVQHGLVQHVLVRGRGDAVEVEIQTSGSPVAPDTQTITGPDRIVVDFPGALPAAGLRALEVNQGALKRVRAGLFFSNPPITRIVLDLLEPQSYRISTIQNAVVIRLGQGDPGQKNLGQENLGQKNSGQGNTGQGDLTQASLGQVGRSPVAGASARTSNSPAAPVARLQYALQNASLPAGQKVAATRVSATVSQTTSAPLPGMVSEAFPQSKPRVTVTYANGMLLIRADKATLAQVLFEVQRQTQAEIAIPAGAELEQVVADLGPAPARDVLAALLNGSLYNFIFVGDELALERVILTRRDALSSP